jgi:hypothetical protein
MSDLPPRIVTHESIMARIDYLLPMLQRARERAESREPFGKIWPELEGGARRAMALVDDLTEHIVEFARQELGIVAITDQQRQLEDGP